MADLIDRQDAIDVVNRALDRETLLNRLVRKVVIDAIRIVPPVQAEPLTDAEQRIFLAAMSREKEVCKEVDYQLSDVREPYEHTLVSVCKEIERKVKAALWTN